MMDRKLEYITRLLKKISGKGIETYVISRIWHLLNNNDIKIIPQQYVRHQHGKYSLTDIYFPQFDIHVEVNEPGHYRSAEKIANDVLRENNIVTASGHQVRTIDCNRSMSDIHAQIDSLIAEIKALLQERSAMNSFRPWDPDNEYKAYYYKNQQVLNVADQVALETIEQICDLFEVRVPKMGFQRKGAVAYPQMENTIIWWPGAHNSKWENTISPDGCLITERATHEEVRRKHASGVIDNPHRRVTFFKDMDILGYTYYRFKGVFSLDTQRSNVTDGLFWIKTENQVQLPTQKIEHA